MRDAAKTDRRDDRPEQRKRPPQAARVAAHIRELQDRISDLEEKVLGYSRRPGANRANQ